ncbi:adenylyl-sulfate kinase [Candidatus Pantoea edessiphila]|uniref:Adenylyl-sulfate kinase n=1 Tax=Candidatus Pantoea edessiphila TaxID=2044610 RepID=A0A2P5T1N2_9GAMM|nr:adenylyl-sulfate kinase [Candidatus Pantoea edessiphila]PPI88463.1 adenylyl-sulfate kinase [Candidatus Pantoea edessiphila]
MRKYKNILWHQHTITRELREKKNGHKGLVLWFTGLSGSGKSTIACFLEKKLYQIGCKTYLLDGDNLRHGLCSDLSFSNYDRKENLRRVGEVAKLMVDAGLLVIAAFISPLRKDRKMVRNFFNKDQFIEVFINTPLSVCESRDPKGLYKAARSGNLINFTGIGSSYEIPENPEIKLDGNQTISTLTIDLVNLLKDRNII